LQTKWYMVSRRTIIKENMSYWEQYKELTKHPGVKFSKARTLFTTREKRTLVNCTETPKTLDYKKVLHTAQDSQMYLLTNIITGWTEKLNKNWNSTMFNNNPRMFRCARCNIGQCPCCLKLHSKALNDL